ncbi:MAG: YgiQ family radical SAM protein [Candidatus Izemoplasmatales bacterium]|jgi:uncharacterized radical SAM protein YgiQ
MGFLPITKAELEAKNIAQVDFICVSGDAYIDHPSFGVAIIARLLERHGWSVAILPQPDISDPNSMMQLGIPKLAWLVTSGNIDSMVNHYTVSKHRRKHDHYTPGGMMGKRPDRAVIRYSNIIRSIDPDTPIILGGIEASLRRLAHYDYWSDCVMRSVLLDARADLLVYGMGERSIIEIAEALASGLMVQDLCFIKGTLYRTKTALSDDEDVVMLPSYTQVSRDKRQYLESFRIHHAHQKSQSQMRLVEPYDNEYVVQNPPQPPLEREELDQIYTLSFMRRTHPLLEAEGHVTALDEVQFSITANRGCFGSCSFCALTMHQGRIVRSRSKESIIDEAKLMINDPEFKGYIHDVGGPTANFYHVPCRMQTEGKVCGHRKCLGDAACDQLHIDHSAYLDVLTALRQLEGIRKVFIRSGIRYDYLLYDKNPAFFESLVRYHISGQLKVAPEHVSPQVLSLMGKPSRKVFDRFLERYQSLNQRYQMKQFIVPYFMSSHPGSTLKDMVMLAEYIRDMGFIPEQVQDFYPTPMSVSTTMYYTGIDPETMQEVYVAKNPHEKAMQRALLQYRNPKNWHLVHEALVKTNRMDLIGTGTKALIRKNPPIFAQRHRRP